jgi:hypothetical protein
MIEATVAMAAMAGLFVAFGLMRIADRASCHGGCAGCSGGDACAAERCAGPEARPQDDAPRESGGIW